MNTRQFNNLITFGTIETISEDGRFASLKIGEIATKPLRLPAVYGANFKMSMPAHESAQAVIIAPSGNLEAAVIAGFLWSQDIAPATSNQKIDGIFFNDGTRLEYNSEDKILNVHSADKITIDAAGDASLNVGGNLTIKAAGNVALEAGGNMKIKASAIDIEGPVKHTGGDMISEGISAQNHVHTETKVKTKKPE